MSTVAELGSAVAAPSARGMSRPTQVTAVGHCRCLVIAESDSRRAMLAQAAEEVGWNVIVCDSVDAGWQVCERDRYEMAIVDLDALEPAAMEAMRDLTAHVAARPNLLLMICGNEANALEEIWARQLGAWLYLPGVTEACDVEALCRQARPVAERLGSAQPSQELFG